LTIAPETTLRGFFIANFQFPIFIFCDIVEHMESTRIYSADLKEYVGKEVTIAGWVDIRRDHGKLIFIDLRDKSLAKSKWYSP
jgi:hypothetical protein